MATLSDQLKKAKKIQPRNLSNDLFKFIRSIENEILDKNREQLYENSKDIFGNPIGFYSGATEVITRGRKKAGEPFDAKETGDFFDGFYMQEVSGVLRFGSTDPKTSLILSSAGNEFAQAGWLSDELFGLSDKDLKEVIESRLLPFLIDNSRNILDL